MFEKEWGKYELKEADRQKWTAVTQTYILAYFRV